MAGASFKMETRSFFRGINEALEKMRRTQTLSEGIGEVLVSSTHQRFKETTDPDGKRWKQSKRAKKEGGQTLVDTARLKNSIGYEATRTMVAVGTNVEYAHAHQAGSRVGRGHRVKLPERKFLGINEDDMKNANELVDDFIRDLFDNLRKSKVKI
ncbi:Phage virion morphogenesis protein [Candidatus Magnetomoraceae bacterium gMMP-15]